MKLKKSETALKVLDDLLRQLRLELSNECQDCQKHFMTNGYLLIENKDIIESTSQDVMARIHDYILNKLITYNGIRS